MPYSSTLYCLANFSEEIILPSVFEACGLRGEGEGGGGGVNYV